jgi:hypothetical protein
VKPANGVMDVAAKLDAIAHHLRDGHADAARSLAAEVLASARSSTAPLRERLCAALLERIGDPHPGVGATFAIMAGALMEEGHVEATRLALGLVAPVAKAVDAARRFVALAGECPEEEEAEDPVSVGDRVLSAATLRRIAARDEPAAAAYSSLDVWYRPAVAAWTRTPEVLRAMQQNARFRDALAGCESANEGAYWLSLLADVAFDAPFVVLVPELDQAWAMRVDGVSDMGQLCVLASLALHEPLVRIGAPEIASERVLAVMQGDGPQQTQGSFDAAFHFYPWQAIDPSTGFPVDDRFTWSAPGGVGGISLPGDFQPAAIRPLDGTRVLTLVGPKAKGGARFTRVLAAVRMFAALRASIDSVRKLSVEEAATWKRRVLSALSS